MCPGKNGYIKQEQILFMKNKAELIITLLFGLAILVYLFPVIFVEAAKLQSGVTITAPATTETEKICDDAIDNDNDGKIDANDQDCAPSSAEPAVEICGNGKDDNKNGKIDEAGCVLVRGFTCGLQILSGVPVNYGQVTIGQDSAEQKVTIKNVGTATATILVKGGGWFADLGLGGILYGGFLSSEPGDTHVATTANLDYNNKKPLSGSGLKLGQISGGQSIPVYFQLRVPTTWPIEADFVQQEVSIDLLCRGTELLKEDEAKGDYNTSAKTPSAPSPLPIPYPDTNNTTKAQIATN
jgi:hypothetical protein